MTRKTNKGASLKLHTFTGIKKVANVELRGQRCDRAQKNCEGSFGKKKAAKRVGNKMLKL